MLWQHERVAVANGLSRTIGPRGRTALIGVAVVLLGMAVAAPAQTVLYVDDDAPAGGDGSSWSAALRYLQDALDAARASGGTVTEIRVAQGTYRPDQGQNVTSGDTEAVFVLVDGVAVRGGYAGLGTADPDARDIEAYQTLSLGEFTAIDLNNLARVDGLTIATGGIGATNSRIAVDRVVLCGVFLQTCPEVTVSRCTFSGLPSHITVFIVDCPNITIHGCTIGSGYPTAVRSFESNLVITDTIITGSGGPPQPFRDSRGIFSTRGSLTVSRCVVSQCVVPDNWSGSGSAITCDGGTATISDSLFTENILAGPLNSPSPWHGIGTLAFNSGEVTITGCTITGNLALQGAGIGMRDMTSAVIRDTTISHNWTYGPYIHNGTVGGGLCSYRDANLVLDGCRIVGNSAVYEGGGVWIFGDRPIIRNCIISGNTNRPMLGGGAGVYLMSVGADPAEMTNCIVTENRAVPLTNRPPSVQWAGGGIQAWGPVSMANCVFWGNEAGLGSQMALFEGSTSSESTVSHCLVQGGQADVYTSDPAILHWGEGNLDADPLFVRLGHLDENGTPYLTFEDRWIEGDYHLLPGSPCIDAGTNTPHDDAANLPAVDLDGVARPQDGDNDGEAVADMGVYERSLEIAVFSVTPTALEFSGAEGGPSPPPQILTLRNTGGSTLSWQLTAACDWVEAVPAAGESAGEADEVTVTIDATGLAHGDYACVLTISDPQAANNPQEVTVVLHVTDTLRVPADYSTIQAAIDAAVKGDLVLVADGTYTSDGNRDIDFLGKAITVRSENGPITTIIDCQGTENEEHRGFFFDGQEGPDSVLEGFTVTNGYAFHSGGGIYCSRSHPTIRNCTLVGNHAGSGGGIYLFGSAAMISDCRIVGNTAGGGLYSGYSYATVSHCLISDNHGYSGGGVRVYNGRLSLMHSTITGNRSDAVGGGLYFDGPSPDFEGTYPADHSIVDCTISGNLAESGGGLAISNGSVTLVNTTLAGNQATNDGGGVHATYQGRVTLANDVLWDNEAARGPAIYLDGRFIPDTILIVSYSDVEQGQAGVQGGEQFVVNWGPSNIDADPRFVAVGHWDTNGTPASDDDFWMDGDYHLLPGSPCIDAGSNAAVPVGVATDLDGRPRFVDDPATPDTGEGTPPIVDMGAYEYAPPPPDFNGDGAVDAADLEHFGDCATGPAAGPPAGGCADADLDRDHDIDQCDFGLFQPWLGWVEPAVVSGRDP